MLGRVSLREQAEADFGRARRKAFLRRVTARLCRDPALATPPCFGEASKRLGAVGGTRLGQREVRSADVVGSVGRCSDFDGAFLPAKASVGEKWKRIDRAFHRGEALPPVTLYKVGDAYFALDGNHRVSVYRYHGVEWIDAHVTEFFARSVPGPARPRTAERSKEHMVPDGAPQRESPAPCATAAAATERPAYARRPV